MTPPRYFDTNYFYHVYNRGNRKDKIFFTYQNKQRFIHRFKEYQKLHPVDVMAYVLMENHYHFLIKPKSPDSITKLFSKLGDSHSKYINIKYQLVGHLFQDRFRAKLVDKDEYLVHLSRYIHVNPVEYFKSLSGTPGVNLEASKLNFLITYPWSSLGEYLDNRFGLVTNKEILLGLGYFKNSNNSLRAYQKFVFDCINNPKLAEVALPTSVL